jgi:hypothetical protein
MASGEDNTMKKPGEPLPELLFGPGAEHSYREQPPAAPELKIIKPEGAGQATAKQDAGEQQAAEDMPVELLAYGYIRGGRQARFLEFQRRGHEPVSERYSNLERIWGPSSRRRDVRGEAFVLEFRDGRKAIVSGCTMRIIVEGIKRESVTRLTELDEDVERFLPEGVSAIYTIRLVGWEEDDVESVDGHRRTG